MGVDDLARDDDAAGHEFGVEAAGQSDEDHGTSQLRVAVGPASHTFATRAAGLDQSRIEPGGEKRPPLVLERADQDRKVFGGVTAVERLRHARRLPSSGNGSQTRFDQGRGPVAKSRSRSRSESTTIACVAGASDAGDVGEPSGAASARIEMAGSRTMIDRPRS